MRIIRLIRPGLFIYECIRIAVLVVFLVHLGRSGLLPFNVLIFATPCALFPLMALFLWLDFSRYSAYLPLYLSGKCICVLLLSGWSIITGRYTMVYNYRYFTSDNITECMVLGDYAVIIGILLIYRSLQKLTETPAVEDAAGTPEMEDK
jgi:hypothetical protein